MTARVAWILAAAAALLLFRGCGSSSQLPDDPRTAQADQQVRRRWGKPLRELPVATLVAISPNNENIQNEFEWAFSLQHAVEHGQRVVIEWRQVGGGGTSIETYLINVYNRSDSSGIDLLWGGGEFPFRKLADLGLLEPARLDEDTLAQIPLELGGVGLRDPQHRWIGSALSGFGFLCNRPMLEKCGATPLPATWDDLGEPRFADLLALADPTQSASASTTYVTVAQSAPTWPEGWAKLLRMLANAKRFMDSAGSAANAPLVGEAPVAACIDFYGLTRVLQAPAELVFVSPRGQTPFTPDPIGILKNPPHPELAQRFVQFVVSRAGQALWALPAGQPDGPARSALGRQPIRRDVYDVYAGQLLPQIVDPYEIGQALELVEQRRQIDFGVLRSLVGVAAIDNRDGLRAARRRLADLGYPPDRLAAFNALPDNIATLEAMKTTSKLLRDPAQRERILTDWQDYFRRKYEQVAR